MSIKLWLEENDKERFKDVYNNIKLSRYSRSDGILTAEVDSRYVLSKIGGDFTLGKLKIYRSKGFFDSKTPFVHIGNNSAYKNGLILTPEYLCDPHNPRKGWSEDDANAREEVVLVRDDGNYIHPTFITRVFLTHNAPWVRKKRENDYHLIVYAMPREQEFLSALGRK